MLKGIIFIIAIIVTFDIGKALIDSYREEHAQEHEIVQDIDVNPENSNAMSNESSPINDENIEVISDKPSINLDLPDSSHLEEETEEESFNDAESSFSTTVNKEKPLNLKAKPIMTFDVETRTPDVNGVTVEVKKTY